jgi:hypothetical protein
MDGLKGRTQNEYVKSSRLACLAWLILAGTLAGARGEGARTNVNPALLYYQGFIEAPDLSPPDRDYLFTNEWRGQKLPDRFGELVSKYDVEFCIIHQAARATASCDWGIDWSAGPATLLPHLLRAMVVTKTVRLRAMWELQHGEQAEARNDLLAAFVMGRNISTDGSILSALVQIAMENIVCSTVAENYYQLSPETLKQLADGMEAAPARGTMATAMKSEKATARDYLLNRILASRNVYSTNDAKVMEVFLGGTEGFSRDDEQFATNFVQHIVTASGGTSEGVIRLLRDMDPFYERITKIMTLPPSEVEERIKQFDADVQNSTNPFVSLFLVALGKVRPKEIQIEVAEAMVRAAVEYKLHGEAGLRTVTDPCGAGPFAIQRFIFEGVDRGFELKSASAGVGYPVVMIFVEKDGPPFNVSFRNAGEATGSGRSSIQK